MMIINDDDNKIYINNKINNGNSITDKIGRNNNNDNDDNYY